MPRAKFAQLLLLAVDWDVSADLRVPHVQADRLRSFHPGCAVDLSARRTSKSSAVTTNDQSIVPSSVGSVTGTRNTTCMLVSLSISPDRSA
jgi:hypothetical protein